jgi:hypothetical protein
MKYTTILRSKLAHNQCWWNLCAVVILPERHFFAVRYPSPLSFSLRLTVMTQLLFGVIVSSPRYGNAQD